MAKLGRKIEDGGNYKHNLARVEDESIVKDLYDKEPTPAWRTRFNEVLKHFKISAQMLYKIAADSGKINWNGNRYTANSMANILQHYNAKSCGWTENARRTINDHLDILVDYLSKPEDAPAKPLSEYPQNVKVGAAIVALGCMLEQEKEEEPKTLLQRLEESGRKPFLPKSGYETIHKSEYVPYKQEPKTLNEQRAEIGLPPMPIKVKLTKVHIIRR